MFNLIPTIKLLNLKLLEKKFENKLNNITKLLDKIKEFLNHDILQKKLFNGPLAAS